MKRAEGLVSAIMDILQSKLGDRVDEYAFPSPVFVAMAGEFLALDLDAGSLTARFPADTHRPRSSAT